MTAPLARSPDVLLVSLGSTSGLREADAELAASLERAGARVAVARAGVPRPVRTLALTDLTWAVAARRAAAAALRELAPRAVLYSSTTAALLGPAAGAVRFDAPAAGNRPGRHGIWQRPAEARRLSRSPLLVPWSAEALAEAPPRVRAVPAVVVPVPVAPSGRAGPRDLAAITYGAHPEKKGLDRVLAAWAAVREPREELVVAGLSAADAARRLGGQAAATPGVRFAGHLPREAYRALVRRARVFVTAPRREDHGIAQLEALADGCALVSTPAPGPYVALNLARALDPRLVGEDLPGQLRAALREPAAGHAERARAAVAPLAPAAVDRIVAERLLPALLG